MRINLQIPPYKDAIGQLLRFCHIKKYPAKTAIMKAGDKGDRLFFILSGSVSVCTENTENGQELILALLNENEFIGEIGLFIGTDKREVSVKTRGECQLAEISYEKIRRLLKNELLDYENEIIYIMNEQLSTRLLNTNRNFGDLAFLDVKGRVARVLLDLCKTPEAVEHPEGIQLHISRQEMGQMVCCSREMVGRVLKELEKKELIATNGKTILVFGAK